MTTPLDDLSPELANQTLGKTRPWAEIHSRVLSDGDGAIPVSDILQFPDRLADKAARSHATEHAVDGADPVTPQAIGALDAGHLDESKDVHPQYLLRGEVPAGSGAGAFMTLDPLTGELFLRAAAEEVVDSEWFTLAPNGDLLLKGSI